MSLSQPNNQPDTKGSWPGLFVSFEGGDGSGKTTLIDRIEQALRTTSIDYVRTREPGGSLLGDELRQLLLGSSAPIAPFAELGLFLSARAQHIQELLLPSLQLGKVVLCDRFNDSTIAYQGFGRHLGREKVERLCELFCDGVIPQLTFYLDLDPKVGLERAKRLNGGSLDRIEIEKLEYHQSVRSAFLEIAKSEPKRVRVIDATRSPEIVFSGAYAALQSELA